MCEFIREFSNEISSIGLPNDKTNRMIDLSIRLIKVYEKFCLKLFNNETCDNFIDVLTFSSSYFVQKLSERDSTYKRSKILHQNDLFVGPEEKAIGTLWKMCKVNITNM